LVLKRFVVWHEIPETVKLIRGSVAKEGGPLVTVPYHRQARAKLRGPAG